MDTRSLHPYFCVLCLAQPKKPGRRREPINASTADEAIEKMLEQKRISTKINYDVLKDLNKSSPKSPTHQSEEPSAGVKKTPMSRQRNLHLSSPTMAKTVSNFGKRYRVGTCLALCFHPHIHLQMLL